MTTYAQGALDIKSIRIQSPAVARRTFNDGVTKIMLREDNDLQVTIDVFVPEGVNGYTFSFPDASTLHATARRFLRVVRITITGASLTHIINLVGTGSNRRHNEWTTEDVVRAFVPYIRGLQFVEH